MGNMQGQPAPQSALTAAGPDRVGRWAPSVCVIVAVASAAILQLGTWSVDNPVRWLFLGLIPAGGCVGLVLSIRNLGRGAADRALDRITLIVSGFLLIGMIPLAFAVMVIVGGP